MVRRLSPESSAASSTRTRGFKSANAVVELLNALGDACVICLP